MKCLLYPGLLVGLVVATVDINSVNLEDYGYKVEMGRVRPNGLRQDSKRSSKVIPSTNNLPSPMFRRYFPSSRSVYSYVAIEAEQYTGESKSAWGTPTLATTLRKGYQDELILDYKPAKEGLPSFQLPSLKIERTEMSCEMLESIIQEDDVADLLSMQKVEKRRRSECSAMLPGFRASSTRYKIAEDFDVVEITSPQAPSFSTTTSRPSSECVIEIHSTYNESGIFKVVCHPSGSESPYLISTLQTVKDANSKFKLLYPLLAAPLPGKAIGLEFYINPLLYGERSNKREYTVVDTTWILLSYKNTVVRKSGVEKLIGDEVDLGKTTG